MLQAASLAIGYDGAPVARGHRRLGGGAARCSACLVPTARARPRCSRPCWAFIRLVAGGRHDRRSAASRPFARRALARSMAYVPPGPGHGVRLHGARSGADGPHAPSWPLLRAGPARSRAGAGGARRARHPRPRRRAKPIASPAASANSASSPARAGPGCAVAGDGRADGEPRSRQPFAGAGAGTRPARSRATASCSRPTIPIRPASLRPGSP